MEELGAEFEGELGDCAGVMWGVRGQGLPLKNDGLFDNQRLNSMLCGFMEPVLVGSGCGCVSTNMFNCSRVHTNLEQHLLVRISYKYLKLFE